MTPEEPEIVYIECRLIDSNNKDNQIGCRYGISGKAYAERHAEAIDHCMKQATEALKRYLADQPNEFDRVLTNAKLIKFIKQENKDDR